MQVALILWKRWTQEKKQWNMAIEIFRRFAIISSQQYLLSVWRRLKPSCRSAVSSPALQKPLACPHAPCVGPEWADPTSGHKTHTINKPSISIHCSNPKNPKANLECCQLLLIDLLGLVLALLIQPVLSFLQQQCQTVTVLLPTSPTQSR